MSRKKQKKHASRKGRRRHPRGNQRGNLPLGTVEVSHSGYGFVETQEGSFYIPKNRMGGAMHGDTVEVRPSRTQRQPGHNRQASVVRVHRRANEYVPGVLKIEEPLAAVLPSDPRLQHDIFVTLDECPAARDGDVVLARMTTYPDRRTAAQGYVVEVLGREDEPGIDIDMIVHTAGLPTEFSPQALEQAGKLTVDIEGALAEQGRRDLRQRDIFTIDPADAKDFDDAISLDHVEGLVRLGVHIADVSSYVEWDSSIDICARDRATSVYLVDRVLPMLPEELSNDICSLRPGQDRRAMTCDLFLDNAAQVVRYDIYPSVICSKRRFNYGEVQGILDARAAGGGADPYAAKLAEFDAIAKQLLARRERAGALDFDSEEAKPVLDEQGQVERVDVRTKTDATQMIEQAMILANETVAAHVCAQKLPLVYRIHEAPRAKALETLLPVLKELKYPIEGLGHGEPRAFQRVLQAAKGRPEEALVNVMVLRSMERARYSVEPLGHFGLASEHYCHFTSPIRRYPDLMVHRLLKDPRAMEGQLEWLAEHASKMERVAEEAERDSVNLKLAEYMSTRVGEVFEGTISSLLHRGFFVRLPNTVEGMVRFDAFRDEYHEFDPKLQTLVGEETGRTYRLGQQVRVRCVKVDVRERYIDFELA